MYALFCVVEHQALEIPVSIWEHLLLLGLPVEQIWYIILCIITDILTYTVRMHAYVCTQLHMYMLYICVYACMYV